MINYEIEKKIFYSIKDITKNIKMFEIIRKKDTSFTKNARLIKDFLENINE